MRRILVCVAMALSIFCMGLLGCSKGDNGQPGGNGKAARDAVPNKQAEKIRETLRTPIEKARAAHDMGDERTRAIDEAVKTQ